MITIIPQDIKNLYLDLLSPRKEKKDVEDILSDMSDEGIGKVLKTFVGQRSIKSQSFFSGEIPLPAPLEDIEFKINSNGLTYYGNVKFTIKDYRGIDKTFENISRKIKKPQTMGILAIDKSLLFMIEKKPYFVFVNENVLCYLKFGSSGTVKRNLSSLEVFEQDVKNLAEVTTNLVNAHYEEETPDIDYELSFS